MPRLLLLLLVAITFIGATARASERRDVSMIQLIASPQQYEGANVRLIGFLNLEFEGDALYLHREDYDRAIPSNGIWIELTDSQRRESAKLGGGYVIVEGIFRAGDRGHLGIFSGSIHEVTRVQSWQFRAKKNRGRSVR
jgi:hypothetical protein